MQKGSFSDDKINLQGHSVLDKSCRAHLMDPDQTALYGALDKCLQLAIWVLKQFLLNLR